MTLTPMLAEEVASNVNWSLIASLVLTLFTGLMWWDARKNRSTFISPQPLSVVGSPPGNAEIHQSIKQLNARMKIIEEWRADLTEKMDRDKQEILTAGEHRAEKLHERINIVLTAVSEVKGTVREMQRHQS